MVDSDFAKWAAGFSGCDGGDIGEPCARSTWICGIEWGGSDDPAELRKHFADDTSQPPPGYSDPKLNLKYAYNRQTLKLITALNDKKVREYRETGEELQPFVAGRKGYFKLNLFPLAFKDTASDRFSKFCEVTGFRTKQNYQDWCREKRFPKLHEWGERYLPKLIVCFGKTYINDFKLAFGNKDCPHEPETLSGKELSWFRSTYDALVAVCPFPGNRHGLNSDKSLQDFGDKLRVLLHHR